jgi:uncharacterized protein YecT (DUF1311 family)
MRVVIGVVAVALALSGCDWMDRAHKVSRVGPAKASPEQVRRACASQLTYARLKEYVFDAAARIRNSDPRGLDPLAAYSVVRMDDPVVKSRDDELNITVCSGRFVLNLPPGIQDAFNGQPVIEADVEYAAQAAADGSGLVYSMNGAEPIIYRIATLGLPTRPMPHIAAAPAAAEGETEAAEIALVEARPEHQPTMTLPVQRAKKTKAVVREQRLVPGPEREVAHQAKATANPSFNCRHAKTASEKMVCGSGTLAAADRRMSAVYYSEMASADAEAKRALRRTRDQFLARRERCSSASCAARVYEERVAEIRRIARN